MMETATDLVKQIADLQAQLRELQHDLPDSAFQIELQRLQRELVTVLAQKQPLVPKPRQVVVQPVPPPTNLTPSEQVTWGTFTDFHKALCSYAGYSPRMEWLKLANTAGSLTEGMPLMGRTDGSQPGPGQIGELLYAQTVPSSGVSMQCWGGYYTICSLTLPPGDWDITGYITFNVQGVTGAASPSWTGWAGISDTPPSGGFVLDGAASEIALLPGGALVAVPILTIGQSLTVSTTYAVSAAVQSLNNTTDAGKALFAWGALFCRRAS